ncbi:hypothetical protein SOVF_098530 [Spinacia oleracea]|nr:hypothetical protein SOVF_098530 [Spinacia oleracea]
MATTSHIISSTTSTFPPPHKPSILPQPPSFLKLPTTSSTKFPAAATTTTSITSQVNLTRVNAIPSTSNSSATTTTTKFYGVCYVVRDDVDTNQIIPAKYSALNPSNPDDYEKLGSCALSGLPNSYAALRFVEENGVKSKYSIIIAGNNFGCGSSNEHAIAALSAAGTRAVVAESYGGVFLTISNSSGVILALESEVRVCEVFKTGDVATIDVGEGILVNRTTGKVYQLKSVANEDVS